ncbi:LysM peptidoglycan-binding domain-containing protein [Ornithinibacillus salinisoli]|uniref:LysM peptidoglycan-binding domain-containing protein n=1 Tax=Ornithinibacillus salinisoli TaxID=1848459 RepID=A0ABW4W0P0_9BACI
MSISTDSHVIYTVQPGDNLHSIASMFSSDIQAIIHSNYLKPPVTDPNLLSPGQILVVPTNTTSITSTFYVVAPGDTLYTIAQRFSAHTDLVAGINQLGNFNLIIAGQRLQVPAFIYNVEPEDTLNEVASRFGVSLHAILSANWRRLGFAPDTIWPNFSLIIPLPSSQNIAIASPLPGTVVWGGLRLAGWGRAFEGVVLYQVRDSTGFVVTNERAISTNASAPAYGWFVTPLQVDRQPTSNLGEIWLYTRSAANNEIQDLVKSRVYFG